MKIHAKIQKIDKLSGGNARIYDSALVRIEEYILYLQNKVHI